MTDSSICTVLVRPSRTHRFCLVKPSIPPGHRGSGQILCDLVHLKDKRCQFAVMGANLSLSNSIVKSNPQSLQDPNIHLCPPRSSPGDLTCISIWNWLAINLILHLLRITSGHCPELQESISLKYSFQKSRVASQMATHPFMNSVHIYILYGI